MLRWWQVPDEIDVLAPGEVLRIERARHQEAALGAAARGGHEERLQRLLAIGGIGPEIGEVGGIAGHGLGRAVKLGIDMAVKRRHPPRAQASRQPLQRGAAGEAEHEIEVAQAPRSDIGESLAFLDPRQGDRRVEVIEQLEGRGAGEHQLGRRDAIRAVGGHDGDVRARRLAQGVAPHLLPLGIEDEPSVRYLAEVARPGVIAHVLFEEDDPAAAPGEALDEPAPERRMTVSPGGADAEAEHDDLHHVSSRAPPWESATVKRRRLP